MKKKIVLITGGARSGKTSYALEMAKEHPTPRLYIATGEPLDNEMKARIDAHKRERKNMGFDTVEEAVDVAGVIDSLDKEGPGYTAVLLDCLTLWLSNIMGRGLDTGLETERLVRSLKDTDASVYLVTNEVGLGIVPDNELARAFRDNAGRLNAGIAKCASEAWLMVSGLPVKIK